MELCAPPRTSVLIIGGRRCAVLSLGESGLWRCQCAVTRVDQPYICNPIARNETRIEMCKTRAAARGGVGVRIFSVEPTNSNRKKTTTCARTAAVAIYIRLHTTYQSSSGRPPAIPERNVDHLGIRHRHSTQDTDTQTRATRCAHTALTQLCQSREPSTAASAFHGGLRRSSQRPPRSRRSGRACWPLGRGRTG